jgi:hypothetical protein
MKIDNFEAFFEAVNNMVREWQPDDPQAGATPRAALEVIYNEVREQAVHNLAELQRHRDEDLAREERQRVLDEERTRPIGP